MTDVLIKLQEWAEDTTLHGTQRTLNTAVEMIENGARNNAIREYMRIAIYFYGQRRIAKAIQLYPRFRIVKAYM